MEHQHKAMSITPRTTAQAVAKKLGIDEVIAHAAAARPHRRHGGRQHQQRASTRAAPARTWRWSAGVTMIKSILRGIAPPLSSHMPRCATSNKACFCL